MTYDRSHRNDDRRRQDEKRKADERKKKTAQQKQLDGQRRAEAQKQPPKRESEPRDKLAAPKPQPTVESLQQQRAKLDALGVQYDPEPFERAIARLQQQQQQPQPEPPKQKGFLDKLGELGGKAQEGLGKAVNTVGSFGAGFGGQFIDNQATTAASDVIDPKGAEKRRNWLRYEGLKNPAFEAGRTTADVVNVIQGFGQMTIGGGTAAGGVGVSATGVGSVVGVPAAAGGAAIATHGAVTSQRAIRNLMSKGRGNGESGNRQNLQDQERSGGHTIEKHVGKSEAWLQKRAQTENERFVSSFNNEAAANRSIGRCIKQNKADIEAWLKSRSGKNLTKVVHMENPVGTWVEKGVSGSNQTNKVKVVFAKDSSNPKGYYVLTAFPAP
jgi:hypothetical protein